MLPYLIGLDGGGHYGELMMSRLIYNFLYDPDVVNSFFVFVRIFNLKSDIKGKDIDSGRSYTVDYSRASLASICCAYSGFFGWQKNRDS
mgnify:CR=1 FL=1